jgi:UDP-N-acetylglucosamine transferase subunit ALG13
VIFVTVGTHQQAFQRLLDGLRGLPDEELVVQYGYGRPPANATEAAAFFGYQEMLDLMTRARVVVTHAGVGSILTARRVGHTPVVVPRLHGFGEHVDDHQVALVRRFEEEGRVVAAWDLGDLPAAVARIPPRKAGGDVDPRLARLQRAVRGALTG